MLLAQSIKALILTLIIITASLPNTVFSANRVEEFQLKAAYLYNFAHFVTFPEQLLENKQRYTFCVYGYGPVTQALKYTLEDQLIAGKPPELLVLSAQDKVDQCQIVYFPQSEIDHFQSLLSTLESKSILTVSDISGFARQGGMIEFIRVKNKIRLIINNDNAKAGNITIKANLLNIATRVSN